MNLTLDGLRPGEYRDIRPEEWKELQKRIEHSSNETVTGGRYGYSPAADERSGKKAERGGKSVLSGRREIMDNREYDELYDRLEKMEKETGIVLADSPTVNVGYEAVDSLPKENHETPMLSLDKTKDREVLREFIGSHKSLLSWKMDGLTIVLTYDT